MSNIKQPFRWQGSKVRMLSKILPLIESARGDAPVYVEPFGGSGAVLNALNPVKIEVYNDADERLADFFRALADDEALAKMKRWGETFPQSRAIYDEMKRDWIKSPELAKRGFATFYVQSFSFGGKPFDSFGTEKTKRPRTVAAYRERAGFAASSSVRLSTDNRGDARKRVETLYISPRCEEKIK